MKKNDIPAFFQKLGKVLMTPVLILPIAGILVGIATAFTTGSVVNTFPFLSQPLFVALMNLMKSVGNIVINNLPVLFAICTACGYARAEKGVAALNGFLAFMMMNVAMGSFLTSIGRMDPSALAVGQSSILGVATLNTGVFGGILAGIMAGWLHNRYYKIELPAVLSFFNGTRFIPLVCALGSIVLGLLLCFIFPPVQSALNSVALFISSTGAAGAFLYGLFERLLLPFGMHLLILIPLMMTPMGGSAMVGGTLVEGPVNVYNAVLNTPGAMFDINTSRFLMNGKPLIAIGYAAIALAIYKTSFEPNRKKIKSLMIATATPCVLTGLSEPIEFSFLFISPALYLFHAFMCGIAYLLSYIFGINVAGTTAFGGPVISLIFNGILQSDKGSNWWWILILAVPYFLIYYFAFKTVIIKRRLQTPGREQDEYIPGTSAPDTEPAQGISPDILTGIIQALGGSDNILSVDSCFTRVRLTLRDPSLAAEDTEFTRKYNAKGVVRVGNGIQIVYGMKAELYKTGLAELVEGK